MAVIFVCDAALGDAEVRTVSSSRFIIYANMKVDMTNERSSLILCLLVMFVSF